MQRTTQRPTIGEHRYDYLHQCWIRYAGTLLNVPTGKQVNLWRVEACGHPATMGPNCCYAGTHAGEIIKQHDQIH